MYIIYLVLFELGESSALITFELGEFRIRMSEFRVPFAFISNQNLAFLDQLKMSSFEVGELLFTVV